MPHFTLLKGRVALRKCCAGIRSAAQVRALDSFGRVHSIGSKERMFAKEAHNTRKSVGEMKKLGVLERGTDEHGFLFLYPRETLCAV